MIPAELRALPQWLAWKYVTRDGRRTKVPLSPHGGHGRSNDPATWGTYRQALATLSADGIGFVFATTDPYVGLDLDNCVADTGALHPAAWKIVHDLGGYVEFSPSGRGLHIIVRGQIERGRHTLKTEWGSELALYSQGRFFTMLGNGRGEIREAQDALSELVAFYFPEPSPRSGPEQQPRRGPLRPFSDDDAAIVDKLLASSATALLWNGSVDGHGGDHSAADLALCAHLAFYTGNDPARVDALFRRSGLMRDKWDSPRGDSTYGGVTIRKAISGR